MPPSADNFPRKRAFKPKSKTGCKTCRVRRIKCDEAKPHCGQCIRGLRQCDFSTSFSFPLTSATPQQTSSSSPSITPVTQHPSLLVGTEQENRFFSFFQNHTVPKLSGPFGSPFWNRLVLQATHHEPGIRHAAVALGCLHERFEAGRLWSLTTDQTVDDGGFALQQYVKAISFLVKPTRDKCEQAAADVVLMTCVLFVGFEALRGHHGAALSHIDGGVKILSELQLEHPPSQKCSKTSLSISSTPYAPLSSFNQIFSTLDSQASQIAYDRPRKFLLPQTLFHNDSGYRSDILSSFCTLDEARNALDDIRTSTISSTQPLARSTSGPDLAQLQLQLTIVRSFSCIRLKQWSSAFSSLLKKRKQIVTEAEQRGIHILKMQRIMMGVYFSVDILRAAGDETVWDEHLPEFEKILRHAAQLVDHHGPEDVNNSQLVFTLDTEIIAALYFVAAKCRHGAVRRKAIALLKKEQRQEGVWNSLLTAKVAERLVAIEEEGTVFLNTDRTSESENARQVPRWKRVVGVEIRFDAEQKRASLKYKKLNENGGVVGAQEWLEWRAGSNRLVMECGVLADTALSLDEESHSQSETAKWMPMENGYPAVYQYSEPYPREEDVVSNTNSSG